MKLEYTWFVKSIVYIRIIGKVFIIILFPAIFTIVVAIIVTVGIVVV